MAPTPEERQLYVTIWSKVVDTQMHFNDMSVKSRQFGLGFVAAALGLGIVLFTRGQDNSFVVPICGGFNLDAVVLIVAASAFALYAVKLLDLNVYHKMLRGAVSFGEDFEENYMKEIFTLEKGMTQAISHFSRYENATVRAQQGKYTYLGERRRNALDKINRFYYVSIGTLLVVALILFLVTGNFGHPRVNKTADMVPAKTSIFHE